MLGFRDTTLKLAKIVCTIGPACETPKILVDMVRAGMNGARLNFSHRTYQAHEAALRNVRQVEKITQVPIAVIQDLSGPKIRVGEIDGGEVFLKTGARIRIVSGPVRGNSDTISVNIPHILRDIRDGERLFLDDGLLTLRVEGKTRKGLMCRIEAGGILKSRKGLNLPDTKLNIPSLTAKDFRDIEWGLAHGVDYFALSFVRSDKEIRAVRKKLVRAGCRAGIIAKIERKEALENIDAIIEASDAILIARGDLGVEIDVTKVPWIQKSLIEKCWQLGKPIITATQMLESMVNHSQPTRAEVTDVTNAVVDGSDVVMLSAETATGQNPVGVVRMMTRIIQTSEKEIARGTDHDKGSKGQFTKHAAHYIYDYGIRKADAKATLIIDPTGLVSIQVAKYDRKQITIVVVANREAARKVALYHSAVPVIIRSAGAKNSDMVLTKALFRIKRAGILRAGDLLAYIEGIQRPDAYFKQLAALRLILLK